MKQETDRKVLELLAREHVLSAGDAAERLGVSGASVRRSFRWLAELGMYAPIVHLQQTDGTKSAHLPFDDAHNKTGVIHAEKVLAALDKSDAVPAAPEMPAPCKEHYLTLELFGGTAELPSSLLRKVDVSARYWRNYL